MIKILNREGETITYDPTKEEQSESYLNWLYNEFMSKIGGEECPATDKDKFGRPVQFVYETGTAKVVVVREYIREDGSWAKKRDVITIEGKEVDNE
jgi:hypothetical protein